jgi:hypothetical protein
VLQPRGQVRLPPGTPCGVIPGFSDNPIPGGQRALPVPDGSYQRTNQQDESKAAYGAINYQLTDRLS